MNDGSASPPAPPPGAKTPGKPPLKLIGIGAVALIGLSTVLFGCNSSAQSAPAGGNPILGTWELVDTNMAAYCRAERVFKTYKDAQASHENPAIYVVKPTYVVVGYGGPNIEEWELHGPDNVTLRMIAHSNPGPGRPGVEGQSNCRYHRK